MNDTAGHQRGRDRRITVLFIDPWPLTREAFARALETSGRDLRVLRLADFEAAHRADAFDGPILILLHAVGAPVSDSRTLATITALRTSLPRMPIVMLSDSEDVDDILDAVEHGVCGYVPMSLELRLLVEALRFVAAGGTFVPAEPLLASLDTPAPGGACAPAADLAALGEARAVGLTPRQLGVLDLLRQGKSNKQIARELAMQEATVKVHVRHIMKKLGVVNRTQVALLADQLAQQTALSDGG